MYKSANLFSPPSFSRCKCKKYLFCREKVKDGGHIVELLSDLDTTLLVPSFAVPNTLNKISPRLVVWCAWYCIPVQIIVPMPKQISNTLFRLRFTILFHIGISAISKHKPHLSVKLPLNFYHMMVTSSQSSWRASTTTFPKWQLTIQ